MMKNETGEKEHFFRHTTDYNYQM